MPLSAKVGAFNITTGVAGTTQAITGVGFTPKVLIFFHNGRVDTVDGVGNRSSGDTMGWAVSTSSRRFVTIRSGDGLADSNTRRGQRADGCFGLLSVGGVWNGVADLQSLDADGFTLIADIQFNQATRVGYLALGGTSLTNPAIENLQAPSVPGSVDYTTLGFQPTALFFISTNQASAGVAQTVDSQRMRGWATGTAAAEQASVANISEDNLTTTDTQHYCRSTDIESMIFPASGVDMLSPMTAFLSNGYRLSWPVVRDPSFHYVLAMNGLNAKAGNLLTRTDTADIVVTGLGFRPAAVLFMSAFDSEPGSGTPAANDRGSMGAGDGASQVSVAVRDRDAMATTDVVTAIEHDNVYVAINATAAAVEGAMELRTLDADGFTCRMTDTDPSAKFVAYLALGPAAAAGGEYAGNLALLGVGA